MVMTFVPFFGAVDYLLYPSQFPALMAVRVLSAAVALFLYTRLRGQWGRRQPQWLALALTLQCGVAVAIIPVYLTGTETPHYVSTCLLIVSAAALLPWAPREIGGLATVLTALFVSAALLHGPVTNVLAFVAQVSAVSISGVLGTIISWLSERMRIRESVARRQLKAASREKTALILHLERMAARLATANEDLQERQSETNDFLYVLSHDLRAPLINIQGFGKRLQTDMLGLQDSLPEAASEDVLRRLGRMQQSLQFLNAGTAKIDQLISRLLELARLATRPGQRLWIDTPAMVSDVISSLRFQLEAAAVDVSVADLPAICGDPVQLNQVFANLIDNAIKYMGTRQRKQITITCDTSGDRYRFGVHDTGPGIDVKDREKVFRLFARIAPNGSAGEGVGLATVRAIVNRHGGRVWVESTPGEGSTFYFTLPRQPAELPGPGDPPVPRNPTPPAHREEIAAHVH